MPDTQKKNAFQVFLNGLITENPTFVLMLGMCPTLGVTTAAMNGIGMGLATTAVLICSNLLISLLRNIIPDKVRIPAFIVVICTFVTMVQMLMQAYFEALYDSLGLFIPLIVVNCIILARAEAFASKNGVLASAVDGIGMGCGFTLAITVIAIIREDLIREDLDPKTPIYMMYKTHADAGSMYNTPNCWAIYVCGKVFKYLKSLGGLTAMQRINEEKAKVMYDFLDSSKMFRGAVDPEFRSLMNIPFVTGDKDLDAEVVAYTKAAGFENLKGHKSVGGLRASTYNAMPKEGVEALVECLKKFEAEH